MQGSNSVVERPGHPVILIGRATPTPGLVSRAIRIGIEACSALAEARRACAIGVAHHLATGAPAEYGWDEIRAAVPAHWGDAIDRLRRINRCLGRCYDRVVDWWVPTGPVANLDPRASSVLEGILWAATDMVAHAEAVGGEPELPVLYSRRTFTWPDDEGIPTLAALRVEGRMLLDAARHGRLEKVPRGRGRPSGLVSDACTRVARGELPPGWGSLDHPARVAALYRMLPEGDPLPPARAPVAAVKLAPPGSTAVGAEVLRQYRPLPSLEAHELLRTLLRAFPKGLALADLANVHSNAHKVLGGLVRSDPLWDLAVELPRGKRSGYRIRSVDEAIRHRPTSHPGAVARTTQS